MSPGDAASGAAGRPAVAVLRDDDWEAVVKAVHSLPAMARKKGYRVATAWARTELRSLVDLLVLGRGETRAAVLAVHRVHLLLGEPFARVMCRDDIAGFNQRTDLLEVVERFALAPTLRTVFARSPQDLERAYEPEPTQ